jgi:hypothetical protein
LAADQTALAPPESPEACQEIMTPSACADFVMAGLNAMNVIKVVSRDFA